MDVIFTKEAFEEYHYWIENDKRIFKKIYTLIQNIKRNKHSGLGHPKPLRNDKSGKWSRVITEEHRLVYRIINNEIIEISQCKGHYDD